MPGINDEVNSSENVVPQGDNRSLSDVLGEALDVAVSKPAAPSAPVAPAAPASAATPPAKPAAATPAGGGEQPRDQFGRFQPKGPESASTPAAPAPAVPKDGATVNPAAAAAPGVAGQPAAGQPAAGQPAAGQPAAVAPEAEAPASWKPEMKQHWASVPNEVRGEIHRRERELQDGFRSVAERANTAQAVLSEFAPYAEQLQREGATPVTAMRTLLQTAHALRTGGPEYRKSIILSLAQQYGVDLTQPYNAQLATAEAQAAQLATERLYGQTQQQQQLQQQAVQAFNAFANDPANEFFPQVRSVMGQIITAGVANDLSTAYQMACGMVPEVRTVLLQREVAKQQQNGTQRQEDDNRRRTAASMSATGAPNGSRMTNAPKMDANGSDLRATLEKALG